MRLFRYSGSKDRMLRHYPGKLVPDGSRRIVEPYLGSGSYSLACLQQDPNLRALGYDTSPDIVALWRWLQSDDAPRDLVVLQRWYEAQTEKVDIRTVPHLTPGMRLYLKVNVCGAYVGQLSSWSIYPQHRLPVDQTLSALTLAQRVDVIEGSGEAHVPAPGDALFVDPPYVGTSGNYAKNGYNPEGTLSLLARCAHVPVMFTYGDGAPALFPGLPWQVACVRKVPNLRRGGTVLRSEHYARMRWV